MGFPLAYCRDGALRLERLRLLYEQRPQDRIFAVMETPSHVLRRFAGAHPGGYCTRPDPAERAAFWDEYLRESAAVSDDSIPSAYLSELDQGLYGGIVGGQVQYMAHPDNGWISSMVPPVVKDWSGVARLRIDRDCEPYLYYRNVLRTFRKKAEGRFGISHFILIDGLNFLFELFGASRTYLELTDAPERVCEAIEFAYRLNVHVQTIFFAEVPLLAGGTCSNMAQWLPGRIVSESLDPFHMTSVDCFERWGREPVERIMAAFDGGVLHIHANGRHLLQAVSSIRGLKAIYLLNDRGIPPAFSVLDRLKPLTGEVPLVVDAEDGEFRGALERRRLIGGVLYKVRGVPDADSANRVMERVREYRM